MITDRQLGDIILDTRTRYADHEQVWLHVARKLIADTFGVDFVRRYLIPSPYPDPFFKNHHELWNNAAAVNELRALGRKTIDLGESIYLLRQETQIDVLWRRFTPERMRASFFEAYCAARFRAANFAILPTKEAGLTKDFDFDAFRSDAKICVEVSEIIVPKFSPKTIENKLRLEVRQLPRDRPGVIACIVPDVWAIEHGQTKIKEALHKAALDRCRNSGRLSAVCFWYGAQFVSQSGEFLSLEIWEPVLNPSARFPLPYIQFLDKDAGDEEQRRETDRVLTEGRSFSQLNRYTEAPAFMAALNAV
jgi:hypothetical protein